MTVYVVILQDRCTGVSVEVFTTINAATDRAAAILIEDLAHWGMSLSDVDRTRRDGSIWQASWGESNSLRVEKREVKE